MADEEVCPKSLLKTVRLYKDGKIMYIAMLEMTVCRLFP